MQWKRSYRETVECNVNHHLNPHFGDRALDRIEKADLLEFRANLVNQPGRTQGRLSAERVNHVMTTLRMIIAEAAARYGFKNPWKEVKPLRVPRTDVDPFTLEEVFLFLDNVRRDFRAYYTTRFLTGMRTGEIDGLQWKYVDLDRRLIRIQETIVDGELDTPKTSPSYREIQMSDLVHESLSKHRDMSDEVEKFVFCTRTGGPLNHRNVTRRVWYPTLDRLGLKRRKPYQTRHTAATLWLAAGENPAWIARQLGHSNPQMLFEVYARFVPNLTRADGSAFERLLQAHVTQFGKED